MKKILKNKINPKITGIVAVVVVLAVILIPRMTGGKEVTYAKEQPPVVGVENPHTGNISVGSSLIGTVEPAESEYVYPQISGQITSMKVKAGQKISAGQVICTIENKQLQNSSISVETAQLNLADAKAEEARSATLYASGDISAQSYEDAKSALNRAQLSYESAANDYANQSEYSSVKASISGTVESCDTEVYDNVTPQTQICVIAGGSEKVVTFDVTERIKSSLAVGDKITVERGGSSFDGSISEISTMVDESSGLFKVKASLAADSDTATGTTVKVHVTSEKSADAMLIPASAVYYEGGEAFVYTNVDSKAEKKPVITGISDEEYIEITSGLSLTDEVVITWSSELYDGAEITAEREAV